MPITQVHIEGESEEQMDEVEIEENNEEVQIVQKLLPIKRHRLEIETDDQEDDLSYRVGLALKHGTFQPKPFELAIEEENEQVEEKQEDLSDTPRVERKIEKNRCTWREIKKEVDDRVVIASNQLGFQPVEETEDQ